jgi:hypothetical protein
MNVGFHQNTDAEVNIKRKCKIYRSRIKIMCITQYKYKKVQTMYRRNRIAHEYNTTM